MTDWLVVLTAEAENDIEEIFRYIAFTLIEPAVAWNQTERIRRGIGKLSFMPERCHIIDEEPWKTRGVRRLNIDNYAAFYVLDKDSYCVNVVRVLYGGRDFSDILFV